MDQAAVTEASHESFEESEPLSAEEAAEVIKDAKDYLELCNTAYGSNRADQVDDLEVLAGNHWPPEVERQRELDNRPCLTINKLPTFLHQVTNDQRQNVPGIKVSPVGSDANDETAKIMQGMTRHIEYASNSDIAYDRAVNSAAAIGEGYFELTTRYCRPDSFDQEIAFRSFRNMFQVYFDPMSEEPDGSDAKRGAVSARVPRKDFEREYPNADATTQGFSSGMGDPTNKEWLGADFVRVMRFYRIEETPAVVVMLSNGESGYEEDLLEMPEGVTVVRKRKGSRPRTMLYKLTALEVLEHTEIKCRWIPLFPVYGDELDIDGKVIRSGVIRHAKDPSKMYDYWMTNATEEVAMRTKTPYIGAEGQFEGYEEEWESANVRNYSYLEYKPVTLDGNLAPPPQRQSMADVPVGQIQMAMHANDNIKATTGLFDSSLGARGNATSGKQEVAQQRQGDLANFHYSDNLNRTVRHVGRCIIDMIPHYYDTHRVVQIMGEDDTVSSVEINKPESAIGSSVAKTLNDVTVGEYAVTVKAGPSYDTLRQQSADSMIELGGKWPKLMEVAGDKVIRAMDWPGASEMADRVKKTIPPQLLEGEDDSEAPPMVQTPRGPIPLDQAGQMLVEMDQQMQEMGAQLRDAQAGIEKARIDADSRIHVAEINAVSKSDVAELQGMIQLLVAKLTPPPVLSTEVASDVAKDGSTSADAPPGAGVQP